MKKSFAVTGLASALALGLTPFALSGCATAHGAVDAVSGVAANALLPPSQENELGEQLSAQIEDEMTMHPDADVQRYIDRLGNRVVRAAKARGEVPEGIEFEFHVIDDDKQINAFAIPGGHIYFFSGLLKAAESEAEVAGVMAHEVAHVTERHVAERLVAQYGLSTLASVALGKNPGMLQQLAAQVVGTGVLLKYSRDQETEADATAIPLLVRSGYDPSGLVTFFERMAKSSGEVPAALQLLQSHPAPSDRVELAKALILSLQDPPTYVGEAEYEDFKDQV